MKVVIVALGIAAACVFGGCGNKDASNVTNVTTEAAEVVSENVSDVARTVGEKDEAEVSEMTVETDQSTEEAVEEAASEEEAEAVEELPPIADSVLESDKSAEYGVNSTSSYDIAEFLDETGQPVWYGDFDSGVYEFFSGRFAYPEVTPCSLYNQVSIQVRSDMNEIVLTSDDAGVNMSMSMVPGLSEYDAAQSTVGESFADGKIVYESVCTVETEYGSVDVVLEKSQMTISREGSDEVKVEDIYAYHFPIGQFSIEFYPGMELSEDDLTEAVNSVKLVGEKK